MSLKSDGSTASRQVSAQSVKAGDQAVVDEQPATAAKGWQLVYWTGLPIAALNVHKEEWGLDVVGELAHVEVVPRRVDAAVASGIAAVTDAVPAHTKPSPLVFSALLRECRLS
jgi:hypothetical protein